MTTASPAPPPARPVGSIIAGRYQIESVIGQGGMGDVYLVKHTVMRKRLALKLLRPEVSQVGEFAARFEREAMAAANIDHPHVAAATDCGHTEDGTLFLALEYVEGQSLREALQGGALAVPRALHIAQQVGSAMVRAHELGIIHRDLKPENIMLTNRGGDPNFVKVLDFGLAKLSAGAAAGDQKAAAQKLTQFGEIFGTPQYMSPEQTTGGEADGRSDLYALGIILYEMLTGRLPFDGTNIADFLRHHLATPLPPMQQRSPQVSVPAWVETLVRRLCEKQAENRFQSAEQFVEALESLAQEHQMVLAPPKTRASAPGGRSPSGPLPIGSSQPQSLSGPQAASSSGTAPAPQRPAAPQTASIVMFMNAVERAQKRLPGPLKGVSPERLAALVAILGLLLFGGIFMGMSALRSSVAGRSSVKPSHVKKPEVPTQEEIQAASMGGSAALQQLAMRYPNSPQVMRPLATAYMRQGQADAALSTLGQLARKSPQIVDEPEIAQFLSAQVLSNREDVSNAAMRALERDFGDRGADLLIQFAEQMQPRSRGRINVSLNNMRSRTDLSPATQVMLELRAAVKCEQKRLVLAKVRQIGDARSLPLLYALQTRNGCSPFGLGDCWGCMRQSTDIEDTIKAVANRSGVAPAGAAPPSADGESDRDSEE